MQTTLRTLRNNVRCGALSTPSAAVRSKHCDRIRLRCISRTLTIDEAHPALFPPRTASALHRVALSIAIADARASRRVLRHVVVCIVVNARRHAERQQVLLVAKADRVEAAARIARRAQARG